MDAPPQEINHHHPIPLLSDLLIVQPQSTIFRDYLRSIGPIESLLRDETKRVTVLAPTNKATLAMTRKPHQPAPGDEHRNGETHVTEEQYELERQENVRRWVSAHIIPGHPFAFEESKNYPTLLEDFSIRFRLVQQSQSTQEGDWVVVPDIQIIEKIEGRNGILYLVNGSILP
ncbi:uncharacterized protein EI90DRAFT_3118167 [Cantharellus anzutake]|uniref:uncharacterized protein n=1 Tax=Cantharellus anzutake TaxID=1750568 RepID=UPI001902FFDA|nr:uncharacterized protein EI90DRAFT_3118167 [Cantharellus anzutake]KAF8339078.1 hypothetical protein EI90DRAFT_3118167 [Cantharellus anzutake]